jgi:RNA polymerase sigma factor (sigma-70 family)
MGNRRLGEILAGVRACAAGTRLGVSDAELLDRFRTRGDETAFELLVRRHERLVFGVCQRVLGHVHDAEDAFQATFLALARKGSAIGNGTAVAAWLYKVAYRIALAARADRSKRTTAHRALDTVANVTEPAETMPTERAELRGLLDEELSRMPERFRTAAVLCYLEGKTVEEAAQQLGCPRGTVASRLVRARARLRDRLARRGVTLSAGMAAVALVRTRISAAAPSRLICTTVEAVKLDGSTHAAATAAVSARVAALTEGALRTMFLTKLKVGSAAILGVVALLLAGGWLAGWGRVRAQPGPQPQAAPAPGGAPAPAVGPPKKGELAGDLARLQGDWELVGRKLGAGRAEAPGNLVFKIRGTTVVAFNRATREEGKSYLSLDERASPKALDLVRGQANGSIATEPAIYKLEGDTLTLCTGRPRGERPRGFRAGGEGLFPTLSIFRRLKEADPAVKASAFDPIPALRRLTREMARSGDLRRLQSIWKATKVERDGKILTSPPGIRWRIAGAMIETLTRGRPSGRSLVSLLSLDEKTAPKTLDLLTGHADGSISVQRGVYKLEGDVLTICMNRPGGPRPQAFRADPDGPFPRIYTFQRDNDPEPGGEEVQTRLVPSLGALKASEVAAFLRKAFEVEERGTPSIAADDWIGALIVRGNARFLDEVEATVGPLKRREKKPAPTETRIFWLRHAKAKELARVLREVFRGEKGRNVAIAVDDPTNALIVRGPLGILDEAEAIASRLDQPNPLGKKKGP